MASSKSCRRYLVEQGAADLIVKLSRSSTRTDTHDLCTLALGYLSEITRLNDGIVKKFLSLSMHPDTSSSSNSSSRSLPLSSRSGSAHRESHDHGGLGGPGLHGLPLEAPEEEDYDDDDDDNDMGMPISGSGRGISSRHGLGGQLNTPSVSRRASGKGVLALKKNIVGNIAGLKAKIKESQESFTVKTTADRQPYVSEKERNKNVDRDTADSELFTLDNEERQLLLVNYGPDSQFR